MDIKTERENKDQKTALLILLFFTRADRKYISKEIRRCMKRKNVKKGNSQWCNRKAVGFGMSQPNDLKCIIAKPVR